LDDAQILENRTEKVVNTPYGNPSDVLIEGQISGVDCVLLARFVKVLPSLLYLITYMDIYLFRHGRNHSIMPSNVNYRANIWALKQVGCTHLIVSTATGSLQEHLAPGNLVIIDNFIDRTTKRHQTFYDGSSEAVGVCHLPMEPAFCERTRQVLIDTAKELGIHAFTKGTIVTIEGPRFSTKAESRMFQQWGADLVGMTICPEAVLAKEAGLLYGVVGLVTDYDCWRESTTNVCVEEVLLTFKKNVSKVTRVLVAAVPQIAKMDWTDSINELKVSVGIFELFKIIHIILISRP
jgi:5'-methylthioadenosine phosphorylase